MSFSSQIAAFSKKANQGITDVRRVAILRLFRDIVMDTPVDEGTLRSNWRANAVSPLTGPLSNRSLEAVFSEMERVLSGSSFTEDVYFNNNMPYAYRIEFLGWSHTKAPQGMVRKNTIRWTQIVEAAARQVTR